MFFLFSFSVTVEDVWALPSSVWWYNMCRDFSQMYVNKTHTQFLTNTFRLIWFLENQRWRRPLTKSNFILTSSLLYTHERLMFRCVCVFHPSSQCIWLYSAAVGRHICGIFHPMTLNNSQPHTHTHCVTRDGVTVRGECVCVCVCVAYRTNSTNVMAGLCTALGLSEVE